MRGPQILDGLLGGVDSLEALPFERDAQHEREGVVIHRLYDTAPTAWRIIARRAARELARQPGAVVDRGIDIPAEAGGAAAEIGMRDVTLTRKASQFDDLSATSLPCGAAGCPSAMIDQAAPLRLYDGGSGDIAFLGFAEADLRGNVNVSRCRDRAPGINGFADFSRAAKRVVFCGTFTTEGLEVEAQDGRLHIVREGATRKFVRSLDKISFNGSLAERDGRRVTFVTERAVLEVAGGCLRLVEIAPGVDVERDIVARIDSTIVIGDDLVTMDADLFR